MRAQQVVGREVELALLESRLRSDTEQLPYAFLIAGEAGIGKSALVRQFHDRAVAGGAQVFVGECTSVEVGRPFGPLVEVLMRAHREPRTRTIVERALADPDLPLPSSLRQGTAAVSNATDPSERYRTHAALLGLLAKLSGIRPLVVALEDLHWADDATLEFLPYAVRKLKSERLLLVLTYRSDELHRRHPLVPVLAELRRAVTVEELRLLPLGRAETAALIKLRLGLPALPEAGLCDAIFERCEGNPYFTEEVLRAGPGPVPVSIREAVWARLASLGEGSRRVAQLAAVIGQRFDFDVLRRVSGDEEDQLITSLSALIDARIVEEAADAAGRAGYVFHHALTREALLGELLERQRQSLHRLVGVALEEMHADDPSAVVEELADQFDAADDRPRACRYHDLAARRADGMLAFKSAARHLERAIARAPNDDTVLGDLELRLARAADLAGDPALVMRACQSALSHSRSPGFERRRGEINVVLSSAYWHGGDGAAARTAMSDAIATLAPLGPSAELALAYSQAGLRSALRGDDDSASEFARMSIELARRFDVPAALSMSLVTLGASRAMQGDRDGLAQIQEGLKVALEHGLATEAMRAYNHLLGSLTALGATPSERRRTHEQSAAIGARFAHYPGMYISHELDYLIADAKWGQAIRESTEIGDTIWRQAGLLQLAVIRTLRDGPDALASAEPHRERLLEASDPQWVSRAASFAAAAFLAHDARLALRCAEQLVANSSPGALTWSALTRISAIAAAQERGDLRAKRQWIDRTLADPRPIEARMTTAARAFAEAAATDDVADALCHLDRAVTLLEGEVLPLAEVIVRLRRAELRSRMAGRADHAVAREDVAAVREFAERAGATWFLQDLQRWSHEHGLRAPQLETGETKVALTRREREIAGLVARGLTDREIATHLVIAPRTAEGHVAHILDKLGFRTRSEIASWSTREQLGAAARTAGPEKRVPTDT